MKKDLTKGNVTKTLLFFAGPMIMGNILQQCYNLADTLIVGQAIWRKSVGLCWFGVYADDVSHLDPHRIMYGQRCGLFSLFWKKRRREISPQYADCFWGDRPDYAYA